MRLLVGIGGTDDSIHALERTVERVRETGDDLTIAVVDNPRSEAAVEEVVEAAREALAAAGVEASIRRLEGDPGSALVDLAETEGFDRLVLGGGETSPMGKLTIGPIAEFVLLNSRVTVTLVR